MDAASKWVKARRRERDALVERGPITSKRVQGNSLPHGRRGRIVPELIGLLDGNRVGTRSVEARISSVGAGQPASGEKEREELRPKKKGPERHSSRPTPSRWLQ